MRTVGPEWVYSFLPHSPAKDNIYSAHSSEAAKEDQPVPGPINFSGMDFPLKLFLGPHSLPQQA